MGRTLIIVLVAWVLPLPTVAQLRLVEFWQSGMVIQRDQPMTVWGWGKPGSVVYVRLDGEDRRTTVAPDSAWQVQLSARPASITPSQLTLRSDSITIELTNLLVGDVYLCAGQSNMAFPVARDQHAAQTLPAAYNSLLRLYDRVPGAFRYNEPFKASDAAHLVPDRYYKPGAWQIADSASVRPFSAVCYYAGRQVQQTTGVPVGLLHMAVGGCPTEAWMQPELDTPDTLLRAIFCRDWWHNTALEPWCVQRGHENLDSLIQVGYPVPRGPLGFNHPYQPGFLYQAAISPMTRLPIKGVLWYQGESNALSLARAQQHEHLFPRLVAGWRRVWQRTELPFYVCQLSSISTEKGYRSEYWPLFRDGQRRLTALLSHVSMAVTSDVGHRTDVHPTDKKTVGERLARVILRQTYRQPLLAAPLPIRVRRRAGEWVLRLENTGTGLQTADGQAVRGFAVGNATGPQTDLSARLDGKQIVLTGVSAGQYLYYGWQPFSTANVVNSAGLPLTTFQLPLP
ncbi:sialate O-acetylesterase (plasmid) [Fibrella sp. ES10-3-2-2]